MIIPIVNFWYILVLASLFYVAIALSINYYKENVLDYRESKQ